MIYQKIITNQLICRLNMLKKKSMSYIFLAICAMVLIGIADFWVKRGINQGLNGIAISIYSVVIMCVSMIIFTYIKKIPLSPNPELIKYASVNGLLLAAANIAMLTALQYVDARVVVPIGRLSLIITTILVFVFLKEKITVEKILGICCAITAIFLLTKK